MKQYESTKVHDYHMAAMQDLSRLKGLLLKTENSYERKLSEATKVPFADRFHDSLVQILSFGLAKVPDRRSEVDNRTRRVHQEFGPLISEIENEVAQLKLDAEQLSEVDRQFIISLRAFTMRSSSGYPSNWPEVSKTIRERDGYQCKQCGESNVVLHVHHVIPLSSGGSNAESNLITLCKRCHASRHPHMRR